CMILITHSSILFPYTTLFRSWGFETDGIIQTAGEAMPDQTKYYTAWGPGDIKYVDLNGDGIINDGSRTISDHVDLKVIGNTTARDRKSTRLNSSHVKISYAVF